MLISFTHQSWKVIYPWKREDFQCSNVEYGINFRVKYEFLIEYFSRYVTNLSQRQAIDGRLVKINKKVWKQFFSYPIITCITVLLRGNHEESFTRAWFYNDSAHLFPITLHMSETPTLLLHPSDVVLSNH